MNMDDAKHEPLVEFTSLTSGQNHELFISFGPEHPPLLIPTTESEIETTISE